MLETTSLSASEQAHIDSGGETPIDETTPVVENTEALREEASTEELQPEAQEIAQKTVPLQALREARQQIKELRERERLGSERLNQLAQIVQTKLGPNQQQQAQEPEIPPVEVDPVAHFKAKAAYLEKQIQQLAQPVQQMTAMQQHQAQIQQLESYVRRQEIEFVKEAPDYADALSHMQRTSFSGLKALGYDDATASQLVQQEYMKLAHNVAINGGNVASHVYELAKANGYAPKQHEMDPAQKLEAQKKGVAASKSLGSGGNVVNGLSLKALADMSPEEFAKATADESVWRKLMGGR